MDEATSTQEDYLRGFYRALGERVLEPDDPFYHRVYADRDLSSMDPIARIRRGIDWSDGQSVQIFSGFRGTGKSTELRRLRAELKASGYEVVLVDIEQRVNLSTPIDVSDFLIVLAGSVSDAVTGLLGKDPLDEGYWTRAVNFFTRTKVDLTGLDLKVGGKSASAQLKMALQHNPTFRQVLQSRLEGHLATLTEDVRAFLAEIVAAVSAARDGSQLVIIVDSFEKIRGTSLNAEAVEASVESLFFTHADKLRFDGLHLVYSAPPWVKIKLGSAPQSFDGSYLIPCLKVQDIQELPFQAGLDAVEAIVRRRGDWRRLLANRATLDRLVRMSGGHLRDLFRMLRSCLQQAVDEQLPVSDRIVDAAISEVRGMYLPLSIEDAVWLERVRVTHQPALEHNEKLHELARFFYTHMVLCYRNGEEWYDVHPLIAEQVEHLAGLST